jgi:hypothetical protein
VSADQSATAAFIQGVYVDPTGNDAGDGSSGQPVRTLSRAVSAAQGQGLHAVFIGIGNYDAGRGLDLPPGISLYGGYQKTALGGGGFSWQRTATTADATTIRGAPNAVRLDAGSSGGSPPPTTLQLVHLLGSEGGSSSVYALRVIGAHADLERVSLDASDAITGGPGTPGRNGSKGGKGGDGTPGGYHVFCGAVGYTGTVLPLDPSCGVRTVNGGPPRGAGGNSALASTHGAFGGGAGGARDETYGPPTYACCRIVFFDGASGDNGGCGQGRVGCGGIGGAGGKTADPGQPGQDGGNGSRGIDGATGNGGGSIPIHGGYGPDFAAADGANGQDGTMGGAGGGGGGGGAQHCGDFCYDKYGNSGGGGGGGGSYGSSGGGGQAGGGSFGAYLFKATVSVTDGSTIAAGHGGNGARGGLGGMGGDGGDGGARAANDLDDVGMGGGGGGGGGGGNGGGGGGGQGGPSAAIFAADDTSSADVGTDTIRTEAGGGAGGASGGAANGQGRPGKTAACVGRCKLILRPLALPDFGVLHGSHVTVGFQPGKTTTATVTLAPGRGGRKASVSLRKLLASRKVRLKAGHLKKLVLHLNRKGRRLVAHPQRGVRLRLTVTLRRRKAKKPLKLTNNILLVKKLPNFKKPSRVRRRHR